LKISRDQLERIRRRHFGYRIMLLYELVLLLLIPVAPTVPPLLSVLLIGLALVWMLFVNRFSGMQRTAPFMTGLGCTAIVLEVIWRASLVFNPGIGRLITVPQVTVWLVFLLALVIRGIKALLKEPFVTTSVLLGAASGYLTIGIAGGVMLTSVWVLEPTAFVASTLPSISGSVHPNAAVASALMNASFGLLTSAGTTVINAKHITAQLLGTLITIAGQLYIAILIGLILGRFQRRT